MRSLLCALLTTAIAAAPKQTTRRVSISPQQQATARAVVARQMTSAPGHFLNSVALAPFFNRLRRAQETHQPVHILQFGDSHTASDDWVNAMRTEFQGRFGDGGPGFVTAGQIRYYRRWDVRSRNSPGWIANGGIGHPDDERHGLSGLSLTATQPDESVAITVSIRHLTLWFLRQPDGGMFTVEADGQQVATVDSGGSWSTGVHSVELLTGEHTYRVRTLTNHPVRLFGWVAQNDQGLTWETLGINGAQVGMILDWNRDIWIQQLQWRDPALIVVAYGTNEAADPRWTAAEYRRKLIQVIGLLRQTTPQAALLFVGPPDCGRFHPLPHLNQVVEIQRDVTRRMGVAFWDWRAHMGGPGASHIWVRAGLTQGDYVHLTGEGYRLLGKTLASELELEFQRDY